MGIVNDEFCMGCFSRNGAAGKVCPVCGFDGTARAIPLHHLPLRTVLNEKYLIGKVLGEGGFGITYIGWDLNLDIKVAVKEFYPTGFVTRENTVTNTVQPFTGEPGTYFQKGRERFVEEAKTLAKFRNLPGIVSVTDFFYTNETSYIVMEYIEGMTLKAYLAESGGKLPADRVFDMMKPVMFSLDKVHLGGMVHRDISPDNIMIDSNGFVKLLDFGAAREFTDSGNRSLSVILKHGYAPEEQYRSRGVQGPWTDVYALCATVYRCITGVTPLESNERLIGDELRAPSELGAEIGRAREAALMKGMAVMQRDRWQSMNGLYEILYGEAREAASAAPMKAPEPAEETDIPVISPNGTEENGTALIWTEDRKANDVKPVKAAEPVAAADPTVFMGEGEADGTVLVEEEAEVKVAPPVLKKKKGDRILYIILACGVFLWIMVMFLIYYNNFNGGIETIMVKLKHLLERILER